MQGKCFIRRALFAVTVVLVRRGSSGTTAGWIQRETERARESRGERGEKVGERMKERD